MREIHDQTILENGKTFVKTLSDRVNSAENNPDPLSFEEIFGNLSDCIFKGGLNLDHLRLNSLKGCPSKIEGWFSLWNLPFLKTLDFFPEEISSGHNLFVDFHHIPAMRHVDFKKYEGVGEIYVNTEDIDFTPDRDFTISLASSFLEFRRSRGSFCNVFVSLDNDSDTRDYLDLDFGQMELIYELYEKVGFNQVKLDRALALL